MNIYLFRRPSTVCSIAIAAFALLSACRPDSSAQTQTIPQPAARPVPPPLPAHVVRTEDGKFSPEAGYAWSTPAAGDFTVLWTAGLPHPTFPHIASSSTENTWVADDGYTFATANDLSSARWTPGRSHSTYGNITASATENSWLADDGYTFATANDISSARWTPGEAHRSYKHIKASPTQDNWRADDGYTFANTGDISSARWTPGDRDSVWPHVVAGNEEGKWQPEPGYKWSSEASNDFSVVRSYSNNTDQDVAKLFAAILVGGIAHEYAAENPNTIGGQIAEELRNEAIKEGIKVLAK